MWPVLFSLVLLLVANDVQAARQINYPAAITAAQTFTAKLTNSQKVNVLSGIGVKNCVYMTTPVTAGSTTYPGPCFADGPLGVRLAYGVSEFPAGVNAAQTWDLDLMYQRAYAIGEEFRGKGATIMTGPDLNMARAPLAGRNWEGFGGDPYLAGEAGFVYVQGVQDNGVIANPKHFLGNEQEHFRSSSSSNMDDRTIREIYGWPFYRAIKAGAASIMCAFNQINNVPSCHTPYMNSILRNEYGFQGFVVSDYNAAYDTNAINNGLDMTQPNAGPFGQNLLNAIGKTVSQSTLDKAVVHVLTAYYALGQNSGYPTPKMNVNNPGAAPVANVNTAAHAALIRKIGAESAVLLKNSNKLLPLRTDLGLKIGVFGTDSTTPTTGDAANGIWLDGTVSMGYGSGAIFFPYIVAPVDAIKSSFGTSNVLSAPNDWDLTTARSVAKQVNVAIVFANVNSGENYVSIDGNYGDRNNYSLWHNGDNLINAVASINQQTIVVLHTTGQVDMSAWVNHPNISTILLAGLPGQETGNSLVDVLTGAVNPSGKLVYTIAKKTTDYPAQVTMTGSGTVPINYNEKLLLDYRWFDQNNIQPQYEFGFGLSYTTFQYSNFQIIGPNQIPYGPANDTTTLITAQLTITNTGAVAGQEIAQLYLAFPALAGEPPRVLRGFKKVNLAAGASTTVTFNLSGYSLSIWDTSSRVWQMIPGTYTLYAAASSRDLRQSATFTVTGSTVGMDIAGADLSGMPIQTASAKACEDKCKITTACVGWVFAYSGASGCSVTNQCWLKGSIAAASASTCRQYGIK